MRVLYGGAGEGENAGDSVPLAGYDHMTVLGIEARVGSLTSDELHEVLAYESAHDARTPVIRLLTARLHRIRHAQQDGSVPKQGGYGPAPRSSRPGHWRPSGAMPR